jgi:hypothetical protein
MHESLFSSYPLAVVPWWRRRSTLMVVAGGLLALVFWTIPNWGTFWEHVAQFPVLWQIPSNRRIIISLSIKILSPLLMMGIVALLVWMYALVITESEAAPQEKPLPRQDEFATSLQETIFTPMQQTANQDAAQPLAQEAALLRRSGALPSERRGPITPLPPVMPSVEALAMSPDAQAISSLVDGEEAESEQENHAVVQPQSASPDLSFEVAQPVLTTNGRVAVADPLMVIRLLKEVTMTLCVPDGDQITVPLSLHVKRLQLLAYLAWRRGEMIDRDKILEHIFGWGMRDEEATEEKLSERFESHKKLIRRKIREVVMEQVNTPAGRQVIDPDIDPFESASGFWGLATICRVEDLETIETNYKVIALARNEGKLVDEIPEEVKEACERLIASYPGDFLASLLKKYPGEFRPWQGRSSWVRKPYTQYRDYYLEALWYAAEYEWRAGQRYVTDEHAAMGEMNQRKQQESFGRAAQLYQRYAMYACNSRFDAKATFGAHGEVGERVGMSERALRRCVMLLGATGSTDLVNQVWSAYSTQMKSISDQRWQPSKETIADVEAARAQTNAYRFAAQVLSATALATERGEKLERADGPRQDVSLETNRKRVELPERSVRT